MAHAYIALLRGINVGGHRKTPMARLRMLASQLGWEDVSSYVQSGNLVFRSEKEAWRLEGELEQAISESFGFEVPVIVRPATRWREMLKGNPFSDVAETEPQRLMMGLAKTAPSAHAASALQERAALGERIRLVDNALWIHFPEGAGRSKITPALLDRMAGSPVTTRNWRTVRQLMLMADGMKVSELMSH